MASTSQTPKSAKPPSLLVAANNASAKPAQSEKLHSVAAAASVVAATKALAKTASMNVAEEATNPRIIVSYEKTTLDSLQSVSIELHRRGFIVEQALANEKSGYALLLTLSSRFIFKIILEKKLEVEPFDRLSALSKLLVLNSAVRKVKSLNFLVKPEAWIAHNDAQVQQIMKEKTNKAQLTSIFKYYGPQISMYYGWLFQYTDLLGLPSVLGIILFLDQVYMSKSVDCSILPFYGIFIAVWTTYFLELSKRNCAVLAYEWKVLGYEDQEAHAEIAKVSS
jgi:hypothetical protein